MEEKNTDELSSLFETLIQRIKEGLLSSSELEPELSKFVSEKNEYPNFLKKKFFKSDNTMQALMMSLMSSISDKSLAPLLKRIIEEKFLNIEFKLKAANILSFIDKSFDEKLLLELGEAARFMDNIHSCKERISESDIRPLSENFFNLRKDLRESVLNQLIEETEEKSLQFISGITLKDPALDIFLIEFLIKSPNHAKVQILLDMYEKSQDKNTRNALKKSFFLLNQKGFKIEIPEEKKKDESPVFKPHTPKCEGYLSILDPEGNQLLIFTIPLLKIYQGLICFQTVINYDEGIKDFRAIEITKKNFKKYASNLLDNKDFVIVEASSEYCRFLLKETAGKMKTPPQGYAECQAFLDEKSIHFEQPLIYQFINRNEINSNGLSENQLIEFLRLPEFEGIYLSPSRIGKYLDQMEDIETSKIVLNQYQKEERIKALIIEAAKELFDNNLKEILRRKLEEISYVLYKSGKEKEAKIALAVTISISESPEKNGFLLALLRESLMKQKGINEAKKKEEPSFIYKP